MRIKRSGQSPDSPVPGARVVRTLERLVAWRGKQEAIYSCYYWAIFIKDGL